MTKKRTLRQEGQHVIHTKEKQGDERGGQRNKDWKSKDWKTCLFVVINLELQQ